MTDLTTQPEREAEARRLDACIADLREQGGPDVQQLAELYEAALSKAEQERDYEHTQRAIQEDRADNLAADLNAAEAQVRDLREALVIAYRYFPVEKFEHGGHPDHVLSDRGLIRRALQATQEDGAGQ